MCQGLSCLTSTHNAPLSLSLSTFRCPGCGQFEGMSHRVRVPHSHGAPVGEGRGRMAPEGVPLGHTGGPQGAKVRIGAVGVKRGAGGARRRGPCTRGGRSASTGAAAGRRSTAGAGGRGACPVPRIRRGEWDWNVVYERPPKRGGNSISSQKKSLPWEGRTIGSGPRIGFPVVTWGCPMLTSPCAKGSHERELGGEESI